MERNARPSSSGLWRGPEAILTSASFLVGAAILVASVVVGVSRDEPGILLLGLIGYLVAGLLAPPRPWATAMLLGLVHAGATLALSLAEPIPWGASCSSSQVSRSASS